MDERPWWRRHLRAIVAAGLALLVVLVAAALASWHFASYVLVPDHSPWSEKVEVEAVASNRIALKRSDAAQRPGVYGLVWQAGHAIRRACRQHQLDEGHAAPARRQWLFGRRDGGRLRQQRLLGQPS